MIRSRRDLFALAAASALPSVARPAHGIPIRDGVPRVDYHAHPENGMTVERAIVLSRERGVKFGLVEHAGVKQSPSDHLSGSDSELDRWIRTLQGKPVFIGIQAERLNWASAFSPGVLEKLDYVLSDALTMPDESGRLVKLWTSEFHTTDPQKFMDRYVDFHLTVLSNSRLDILANPTFLPKALEPDYDRLWTEPRMRKVIDGCLKHRTAIEINSRYKVPRLSFLKLAKAAGCTFSFGSNMHTAEGIGQIDYCVDAYRRLELSMEQFFVPRRYRG
jgi:histidinol phosphatase-like PHP family hydrolase